MSLTAEILLPVRRPDRRRLQAWRRLIGTVVVLSSLVGLGLWLFGGALWSADGVSGGTSRWSWTEQDVPPEISKEGWPEVEILEPQPGAVLTGPVLLRWRGDTPAGFGGLEIRVDRRRVFQFHEPTWEKMLDTSFLPEGEHTLEIRLMDVDRRRGFASVDVTVRKPQFALLRVARPAGEAVSNGHEVVVAVTTSGTEFEPRADFSALDSAFDPARVRWRESPREAGSYEVRYRLSEGNTRPDGPYWVYITLADQQAPSVVQGKQLVVDLQNSPRQRRTQQRPIDISCAVFRPEAVPPSRGTTTPLSLSGPTTAKIGQDTELTLDWQGDSEAGRGLVRVTVDGLFGHFALLGSCGAGDSIAVRPLEVGEAPLRLAVWSDLGLPAVHTLEVVP